MRGVFSKYFNEKNEGLKRSSLLHHPKLGAYHVNTIKRYKRVGFCRLTEAHYPEGVPPLCPGNGVFTDQFILRSIFPQILNIKIVLQISHKKTGD